MRCEAQSLFHWTDKQARLTASSCNADNHHETLRHALQFLEKDGCQTTLGTKQQSLLSNCKPGICAGCRMPWPLQHTIRTPQSRYRTGYSRLKERRWQILRGLVASGIDQLLLE